MSSEIEKEIPCMQQPSSSPADQLASQYQLGMLRDTSFENKVFGQIIGLIISLILLVGLGSLLTQVGTPLSWPFLVVLFMALMALLITITSVRAVARKYRQRGTALSL